MVYDQLEKSVTFKRKLKKQFKLYYRASKLEIRERKRTQFTQNLIHFGLMEGFFN